MFENQKFTKFWLLWVATIHVAENFLERRVLGILDPLKREHRGQISSFKIREET